MKIIHLINDTYQVVNEDENILYFQGSQEECEKYLNQNKMNTTKLTAVEKAKDFVNKFGKELAIKVVYEILEAKPSYKYWRTDYDETPSAIIYWQEVKDELNKSE